MEILKNALLFYMFVTALSCKEGDKTPSVKQENGELWLSGGLYYCAQQIRLDNRDTLVVSMEDVKSLRSGDRVTIRFRELGKNKNCSQYTDCEVIEISKLE